jgi:hypothetical protein
MVAKNRITRRIISPMAYLKYLVVFHFQRSIAIVVFFRVEVSLQIQRGNRVLGLG